MMFSRRMLVMFPFLILCIICVSDAAIRDQGPKPEALLLVRGMPYDFSWEASVRACAAPVGLEKNELFDGSFTASSYSQGDRSPQNARLNSNSGWQPRVSDLEQWLTIDLGQVYRITGVGTQAGAWIGDASGNYGNWVTRYYLQYSDSNNANDFVDYVVNGQTQHFDGNVSPVNVVQQRLVIPIISRYIRIRPEAWNNAIGLRVELYGCFHSSDLLRLTGKEVLRMDTDSSFSTFETAVSMRFRTDRPNGLLVHGIGSSGDYFAVEIVKGVLVVNVNLGTSDTIDGRTSVRVGQSLYDNQWHSIEVSRRGRALSILLDGYRTQVTTNGSFENLNVDTRYTFGGTDRFNLAGITTTQMFRGCVENIRFDDRLVISNVKANMPGFSYKGILVTLCQEQVEVPVTFEDTRSMIYIEQSTWSSQRTTLNDIIARRESLTPFLVVEFSFRTWEESGLILYNEYSQGSNGYLQIGLFQSRLQILVYMSGDQTPYRYANIGYENLNDGAWHATRIEFTSQSFIIVTIDEEVYPVARSYDDFVPSDNWHFGGVNEAVAAYSPSLAGYIGCLRGLTINGIEMPLSRVLRGDLRLQNGGRVQLIGSPLIDQCPIVDRCTPNPCFHGGKCFQNWFDFHCDCFTTNYENDKLCHSSAFMPSCEAYEFVNDTSSGNRYIDPDGCGPIKPFLAYCMIGSAQTSRDRSDTTRRQALGYMHTLYSNMNVENRRRQSVVTEIFSDHSSTAKRLQGDYPEPGSLVLPASYGGSDISDLGFFADFSAHCRQYIKATCWGSSKLLDYPNTAMSWWTSRQGYKMTHWGNTTADSNKCGCAMTPGQSCSDPNKFCNCDATRTSASDKGSDEGWLVEKEYLPVREIRAGGLRGRGPSAASKIDFTLGSLLCTGDLRMENGASFWSERSGLWFPTTLPRSYWALEISFYFKTRRRQGVFIHMTGSDNNRQFNFPRHRDRDGNAFYTPSINTDGFMVSLVYKPEISETSILEVRYDVGFEERVYPFAKQAQTELADGMWHYVKVAYTIVDLTVRVDNNVWRPAEPGEDIYMGSSQDPNSWTYDRTAKEERLYMNDQIHVGSDSRQNNGFVGCMKALMVNGQLQDLRGKAEQDPGYMVYPGFVGQCDRNPCQNNGICFEKWDGFQCDCRESAFEGEICTEEVGYYFDGSDSVQWNIPSSFQKSMPSEVITFGFSTDRKTGTIFELIQDDNTFIRASISGQGIRVEFSYGGMYFVIEDVNNFVDNQFHSVVVRRDSQLTMQVDNYPTVIMTNVPSVPGITNPRTFYVGEARNFGGAANGFIGCISRVRVNHLVPLKAPGLDTSRGGYRGTCDQLAPTIDPIWPPEFFPNWDNDSYQLPQGSVRDRRMYDVDTNIAVGVAVVAGVAFLVVALVAFKYFTRKGSYRTQEDAGAYHAYDANSAVKYSSHRLPEITTREEIFI